MISKLCGTLIQENNKNYIEIDKKITVEFKTTNNFPNKNFMLSYRGDNLIIHTHLTFSEQTGFNLYGFETEEQKQFFLDLISVQGIGYNLALSIMSQIDYEDFKVYVFNKDKKLLCKIKGIGIKGVEKIIKQLKKYYQ